MYMSYFNLYSLRTIQLHDNQWENFAKRKEVAFNLAMTGKQKVARVELELKGDLSVQ